MRIMAIVQKFHRRNREECCDRKSKAVTVKIQNQAEDLMAWASMGSMGLNLFSDMSNTWGQPPVPGTYRFHFGDRGF